VSPVPGTARNGVSGDETGSSPASSSATVGFPFPLSTLLGRVQSIFAAEFDRRLAEAGMPDLTLSLGTNVMRHLQAEQAVRFGVLAEMSGVSKQAISQQVSHLEARGYLCVETDPHDSRARQARLTDKGIRSQHVSRPIFAELENEWQLRFGKPEIRELRATLERILAGFDDTDIAPRTRHPDHRVSP